MPRIRKKTSKRGTSHQRAKVKHKVAESRKKSKKEAKKSTQWKSKHTKDPGIPNNFPYKDQILAEVAAQRRQDEEDKQKRKEQRKAEKAAAKAGADGEEQEQEDDTSGFDGIRTLKMASKPSAKGKERTVVVEEDDEDVPILVNSEYANLKTVLDKADIVLQVLDARDPLAFRSSHIQQYTSERKESKTLLILNKIDACPRETVQAWVTTLRKELPTHLFRSASAFLPKIEEQKATGSETSEAYSFSDAVGVDALLGALNAEAAKKDTPLCVAVVGVANTGKSSLINSLLRKSISPIYKLATTSMGPSTTERPLEVTLEHDGKQIHFIDTPALTWETPADLDGSSASKLRAKDMLLRNKGRIDRAKDPLTPVSDIVARANAEDLMLFYTLPAFTPDDATAFLSALARARGLVKRRGELDHAGAARIVLRDWSTGRLPRFSQHPAPAGNVDAGLDAADEEALKAAPLRKEMRKGRGIVRLVPGVVETRTVGLEMPWDADAGGSSEEDEGDVGDVQVASEEDEGSEDEEEDEDEDASEVAVEEIDVEEEEEDLPPSPKGKRKRQEKLASAPASKKVMFAALPKVGKQVRAQPTPKPVKSVPAGKAKRQRK
ncbi:hypothetical protein M0805_007318 [Coniferiporia weirii]|nr:hypothetical protein M0805_007318 [Coniferiporia weirii]